MYWFWFIKTLAQHLQFCWTNMAKLKTSPNFIRRHIFQIVGKLPHHPRTENSLLFLITGWLWHDPFTVDFVQSLEGIIIPLFHLCSSRVSFQSATSLPKKNHNTSQVQNTPSHSHSRLTYVEQVDIFPKDSQAQGPPVPCSNDPLPCSTNPRQQSWTKCSPAPKIQRGRDWRLKLHPWKLHILYMNLKQNSQMEELNMWN